MLIVAQEKIVYGNVTLSQLTHFIVEVCGKDALTGKGYVTDSELNDAYKEKGSYLKFRYTDENSLFGRIFKFFKDLETEFKIPLIEITRKKTLNGQYFEKIEISDFHLFYSHIIWHFIIQICGTRPFENIQNNFSKKLIFDCLLKQPDSFLVEYINTFCKCSFSDLIQEFLDKHQVNYEDFYQQVASFMNPNEKDTFLHARKTLQKSRKDNNNPPWKVFYPMLKAVNVIDTECVSLFLNQYFYSNFRNAVEYLSFKKTDLYNLEKFCENFSSDQIVSFIENNVSMSDLRDISIIGAYFDDILSKNSRRNIEVFQNDIKDMRLDIPHSFSFWGNWFCAKDYVLNYINSGDLEKLKNAVDWYERAFECGKYYMGKSAEQFIHEAVSVSVYYDFKKNPVAARTRLQKNSDSSSDTKTPLDRLSKIFYDFGLSFDLVLNETNDASVLYYKCCHNFWNYFIPESDFAEKLRSEELAKEDGIKFNESEEESVYKAKDFLANIKDSKINNILPTTHNIAYTPVSTAIIQNYYDIVEQYLNSQNYPSLDLNISNTNNCYPIHEIVTQYVRSPYKDKLEEKNIVLRILERTDKKVLFTQTNRQKLSPLQTVIQSFDLELNKAFLDKMFGSEKIPDDFLISADEISPLYFLIMAKYMCIDFDSFMSRRNIGNINYKNLFAAGMNEREKSNNDITEDPVFKIMKKAMDDASKSIPKDLLENLKKETEQKIASVIDLYIERTADVDAFIAYSMRDPLVNNQGCTTLLYTCEMNDVSVCKKLIQAGADLRKQIGMVSTIRNPNGSELLMPNNFIHRAIEFDAWDCLEMFLTDYRNIASEFMHRKEVNMTYFVCFLIKLLSEICLNPAKTSANLNLINRFVPLFLSAGASMSEPTVWGTAGDVLKSMNLYF